MIECSYSLIIVVGVYFSKYAKNIAETLDVKGWIRVNSRGSVYGQIQGEKDKVDEMYVLSNFLFLKR